MNTNTLKLGPHVFAIAKATFRYVTDNGAGTPGWEFDIRTTARKDLTPRSMLFGIAPRFYSEGDAIPLDNLKDLTGQQVDLKEPNDPETGDVYFTLYVFEHGDLTNLKLKFLKKKERSYRIQVSATVPHGTVFSTSKRLQIDTWIRQLPAQNYAE